MVTLSLCTRVGSAVALSVITAATAPFQAARECRRNGAASPAMGYTLQPLQVAARSLALPLRSMVLSHARLHVLTPTCVHADMIHTCAHGQMGQAV